LQGSYHIKADLNKVTLIIREKRVYQRNANIKHPKDIGVMPAQLSNPLAMAVANRDTQTLEMVRASVSHKNIMLAYQPVVQAQNPSLAERLILEITERSTMLVPELVARFMSDLQARGISFALDDFGAGHTAFRHFKKNFTLIKTSA
jgi:sensor c-di-GMP phosphodiesterase-like protein